MSLTLVQKASGTNSATLGSAPTAGNLILVTSWVYPNATISTPVMTGNTFIKPGNLPHNTTASGGIGTFGAYATIHQSGASSTVNGTTGGVATTVTIAEYSWSGGVIGSISFDGNSAIGDGIAGGSTSYTPSVTADGLFYYIDTAGNVTGITGAGWTLIEANLPQSGNGWAFQNGTLTAVTGTSDQTTSDCGFIFGVEVSSSGGSIPGTGAGSFTFSGSATGTVSYPGTGAGTYTFSGSATGTVKYPGTATGTYSFSGAAAGTTGGTTSGTGSGSFGFTGSATGSVTYPGTGSGTYSFSGSATGGIAATGTGTFSFSGSATGTVKYPGVGTGTYAFSGSASGSVLALGASSFSFSGVATGTVTYSATGAATFGFTGLAASTATFHGTGHATFGFVGAGFSVSPSANNNYQQTYLPNPQVSADETVEQNFEYIESFAEFRDPNTSVVRGPRVVPTGPPTTGTWAVSDHVIDNAGNLWVCIVAGKPGTWIKSGSGLGYNTFRNPSVNVGALSFGTEAVVATVSLIVTNPKGAFVAVRGGCFAYATAAGVLNQNVETDSLGYSLVAAFYFTNINQYLWCGDWEVKGGPLSPGSHTFTLGCTAASGGMTMDSACQAYITAQELP